MNARRASVMERQQAVNEEINARNRADMKEELLLVNKWVLI